MALRNEFYQEIEDNEKYWKELNNRKLLNPIYLNIELKPFYENKKQELEEELKNSNNPLLFNILNIINNILSKIEDIDNSYRSGKEFNISDLVTQFLQSQMNNENKIEKKPAIDRKKYLEDLKKIYVVSQPPKDDSYLYEDDTPIKIK